MLKRLSRQKPNKIGSEKSTAVRFLPAVRSRLARSGGQFAYFGCLCCGMNASALLLHHPVPSSLLPRVIDGHGQIMHCTRRHEQYTRRFELVQLSLALEPPHGFVFGAH